MQQLINHSRFAGRHETATRPGHKAGSEVWWRVGTRGSKKVQ